MKPNPGRQNGDAFAILRGSLSRLNLPADLVNELIERHISVSYEKGAWAFCEGNTDGMVAYIMSGYVNVYCPVGDGNRTLVRMAGPGEVIGYPDYVDEKDAPRACSKPRLRANARWRSLAAIIWRGCWPVFPTDGLIAIVTALNTFWSENLWFFATLLNLPLYDRLMIVMSDLAKRLGVRDSEGIVLIPEIFHDDLAEMIGCSRPMISRLIAQMVESGLLARRGKQYVLLKKWDFEKSSRTPERIRNAQKAVGRPESASQEKSSPSRFQRAPQVSL